MKTDNKTNEVSINLKKEICVNCGINKQDKKSNDMLFCLDCYNFGGKRK